MAGFWTRVEDWLLALRRDRERAARAFRVAYWISLAVVVLGFMIIVYELARKASA